MTRVIAYRIHHEQKVCPLNNIISNGAFVEAMSLIQRPRFNIICFGILWHYLNKSSLRINVKSVGTYLLVF